MPAEGWPITLNPLATEPQSGTAALSLYMGRAKIVECLDCSSHYLLPLTFTFRLRNLLFAIYYLLFAEGSNPLAKLTLGPLPLHGACGSSGQQGLTGGPLPLHGVCKYVECEDYNQIAKRFPHLLFPI